MTATNILYILIDDLGAMDLGCTGSSFYETPHIDRLFAEGACCTKAYASCPVCSPTRASIMTGRAPARVGITNFIGGSNAGRLELVPYLHHLPLQEVSLATVLGEAGYQTWHVGKWHLGGEATHPDKHGFDINIGGCHMGMPRQGYFAPWGIPTLPEAPDGTELTSHLTDQAIGLINQREQDKPFFLHLAHYSVHTPIQAPADLIDKYVHKARRMGLDRLDPLVDSGRHYPYLGARHGQTIRRRVVQSHPVYAAMVEHLDREVGRLLQALDAAGLRDDTLVVFTSDNGGLAHHDLAPTSNLPLAEGKGWLEEGGIRIPQCLRWPGRIAAGSRCTVPVTSMDLFPTALDAAGLALRPELHADGQSLLPTVTAGADLQREALFWHYPHYSNCGNLPGAIALSGDGRWKMVQVFEGNKRLLFDLENDPGEVHDCAVLYPERVAELDRALSAWQQDVCARFPGPNPEWPGAVGTIHPGLTP